MAQTPVPSSDVILPPAPASQDLAGARLIRLAREIAMEIRSVEEILDVMKMGQEEYDGICAMPQFQRYLRAALEEWGSAANTGERVKLKAMAFVEESLPEFYARAHDPKEALSAKIEVLKTVSRFAGIGGQVTAGAVGERMTVTINLGADHQLRIEKDITPAIDEEDRL